MSKKSIKNDCSSKPKGKEKVMSMFEINHLIHSIQCDGGNGGWSQGLGLSDIGFNLFSMNRCGKKDKKEAIKVIAEIAALGNITRRNGLLELVEVIEHLSCDFLKIGIQMIVDGVDPSLVKQTMLKVLFTEGFKGAEFLKRLIITEGVLSIQSRDSAYFIKMKLFSFLGEKFLHQFLHEHSKYSILGGTLSEFDAMLNQYNPLLAAGTDIAETIKNASESGSFKLIKQGFEKLMGSDLMLKGLSSFFLFNNSESFKGKSNEVSEKMLEFIDKTLSDEVFSWEGKRLADEQAREMADTIQSCFLSNKQNIVNAVKLALAENVGLDTKYRNRSIEKYIADIGNRFKEFYKVIFSMVIRKLNLLQLNHEYLIKIINFTIIDGKRAMDFITDTTIVDTFKAIENEIFQ